MPAGRTQPSPEAIANGLLRTWAAKVAAREGRNPGAVLREAGILDYRAQKSVYDREMNFSFYERNVEPKEEQED